MKLNSMKRLGAFAGLFLTVIAHQNCSQMPYEVYKVQDGVQSQSLASEIASDPKSSAESAQSQISNLEAETMRVANIEAFSSVISAQPPSVCSELEKLRNSDADATKELQNCVNNSVGKKIELEPGSYKLSATVLIKGPITILPKNKLVSDLPCLGEGDSQCLTFYSDYNVQAAAGRKGLLHLEGDKIFMSHIIVDGRRAQRVGSDNYNKCKSGDNGSALNVSVEATNSMVINSVFKDVLCGSAFEVHAQTSSLTFSNNKILSNGSHYEDRLWSDGLTVHDTKDSVFTDNTFVDNTDVQMIFGGCANCKIARNHFSHEMGNTAGASFAELMIYSWASTSGNYTGTTVADNVIDCGVDRNCAYGILVGGDSWNDAPRVFGGNLIRNNIKRAMIGLSVDEISDVFLVKDNSIEDILGGELACQNDPSRRVKAAIFNVAPKSYKLLTEDSRQQFDQAAKEWNPGAYTMADYDGCIPRPPYLSHLSFTKKSNDKPAQLAYVELLYKGLLGREIDEVGASFYPGRIDHVGFKTVIKEVSLSPEATARFLKISNDEFAIGVYLAVLGREPDVEGYKYWMDQLNQNRITKLELLNSISDSEEFIARCNRDAIKL
jgi:hypothetical protein